MTHHANRSHTPPRRSAREYEREIARLKDYIRDIDDDFAQTVAGDCAPDEKHCSCVPYLRKRIRDLTRMGLEQTQRLQDALDIIKQVHRRKRLSYDTVGIWHSIEAARSNGEYVFGEARLAVRAISHCNGSGQVSIPYGQRTCRGCASCGVEA